MSELNPKIIEYRKSKEDSKVLRKDNDFLIEKLQHILLEVEYIEPQDLTRAEVNMKIKILSLINYLKEV